MNVWVGDEERALGMQAVEGSEPRVPAVSPYRTTVPPTPTIVARGAVEGLDPLSLGAPPGYTQAYAS